MERRTFVSFEWDAPDDGEFDSAGNLVAPGGRQVLEDIRGRLCQKGFRATDVDLHEFYGWSCDVFVGQVPVWCMIQYPEPWLIMTEVELPLLYWFRGFRPAERHSSVCKAIHEVLTSSKRARTIRWFSRREYSKYNVGRGRDGADSP